MLSPVILIIGCDLIPQAYNDGYSCGYQAADSYFACARGCEEERQQRETEILEWEDACAGSVQDHFSSQPPIESADRQCADQYNFDSRLVVCDDVGQEPDTHPPGCRPFREPTFATIDGNYDCPADMTGRDSKLCLCCDDVDRPLCDLSGGFCRDNDDCCSGTCVLEPQPDAGPDAGPFQPAPRGTCD